MQIAFSARCQKEWSSRSRLFLRYRLILRRSQSYCRLSIFVCIHIFDHHFFAVVVSLSEHALSSKCRQFRCSRQTSERWSMHFQEFSRVVKTTRTFTIIRIWNRIINFSHIPEFEKLLKHTIVMTNKVAHSMSKPNSLLSELMHLLCAIDRFWESTWSKKCESIFSSNLCLDLFLIHQASWDERDLLTSSRAISKLKTRR